MWREEPGTGAQAPRTSVDRVSKHTHMHTHSVCALQVDPVPAFHYGYGKAPNCLFHRKKNLVKSTWCQLIFQELCAIKDLKIRFLIL